jgi:hypothetical protein
MKKPSLLLQIIGFIVVLLWADRNLPAQSPSPMAISPAPSPSPRCPTGFGWAEGLVNYMGYPAPAFPTQDTANNPSTDCAFHQWSWEAFVWATAIGTDGRARFATLANVDELGQKTPAKVKGPKPLGLKPRDLKPPGPRQTPGPAQAGGGILVDQNGQILWYSAHMNDIYYQFLQKYSGMNAYNKAAATLNFPVGAAVFKASWQVVPDGITPVGVYTEKSTVPALMTNPKGGIMIDPKGKPRNVTVALVGLHVVGVTVHHPEFLWATFEQVNNAPDLADPSGYNSPNPVSPKSFTFYAGGTAAKDCNPSPSSTSLKVTDPVKQTVAPITNVFRQYATGGENAAGDQEIAVINSGAQGVMANMATGRPPRPAETVWANYKLIGTLWIKPDTLAPGVDQLEKQGVGSINLANGTLETFFQGPQNNFNGNAMANCFMCHNTGGSGKGQTPVYPGKNINLSHALLGTLNSASTTKPAPALAAPVKEAR